VTGFYKQQYNVDKITESVHNYINFEDGIVRKGAISAHKGEKVIIPLNMADGIILGIGKGNEDFNNSSAHGAGRKMSRSKAKASIRLEDFQFRMREAGVWSTCIGTDTLDESPQAYKKAEKIIELLEPTVEVTSHMKPVYVFKAGEEHRREDI
jgi:RNA-splicing ligase RtcB